VAWNSVVKLRVSGMTEGLRAELASERLQATEVKFEADTKCLHNPHKINSYRHNRYNMRQSVNKMVDITIREIARRF
jgi:hypothetical protein